MFSFSIRYFKALIFAVLCVTPMLAYAAEPIKIGLMCPLTGGWASEGQDMQQVLSMLTKQVNDAGGIKGRLIELIVEDDAGDPRTAALAAQKLVSSGVIAIVGTYGSAVTEASQNIIDEAEVLQIAVGSTSVRLTEKGMPLFMRTCPRDDDQGRVAAKTIVSQGFKRVAILHDNSSYAKGLADETVKSLKGEDVEIVFFDALTPKERDYTAILTKLKSVKPDVVFFTGYFSDAGTLLRQKAEMQWDVPMMGGDAANHIDLVKIAGKKAAEGYIFVSPASPGEFKNPEADAFYREYVKKYKAMPGSMYAVFAGDAFKVIIHALKEGVPPESKAIAKYLKEELKDYPGLSGSLAFNEKGDRVGDLYYLYKVDADGKFIIQR